MLMTGIFSLTAFAAGMIQGITGFGAGIILMLMLPHYFPLIQAAGISGAINIPLCIGIMLRYRSHINVRKAALPAMLFMAAAGIAITFSTCINGALLKKVFGCFLIVLSVYYLFFNKKTSRMLKLPIKILYIAVSGICNGLFGIGGPLMVLYFLTQTDSKEEYFGTLQTVFCVNLIYTTTLRMAKGILMPKHILTILMGTLFILLGLWFANRIVDRMDAEKVKRITYLVIGISGILNLI